MLDLDHLRAEFGRYLTENTTTRWGLDQALMHVCKLAYEQGQKGGIVDYDMLGQPITRADVLSYSQRWATDVHGRKLYPLDVPTVGGVE